MNEHLVTIGQPFLSDLYDVSCSCGFEVAGLSSHEAALNTAYWHKQRPDEREADNGEAGIDDWEDET